ncbi:hypothetical protein HDU92_007789 [Lobulomyces angularis]|nr:hypothetical protein HDU92_007789 [Lobulomyces angularis]
MLNSLVQKIPEKLLAIFLDESQLIVDVGSDSFPSKSTPGATCTLLNAIKNSISNEAEKFCFIPTGTGLRIGDVHGEGSKLSSAAKDSKQSLILTVSNVWETPDDIQKYLSRYLGSSFILEKEKACLLLGRVRPVALFLEQCLLCIDTDFEINNYFEEFWKELTNVSKLQWSLSYLFDSSRFSVDTDFLQTMEILKKAVYFQLCFGFPYVVNVDSDARLFEYSFGILLEQRLKNSVERNVVVNESFILQTAYNILSKENDFLRITAETRIGESLIAQSRGYLWEEYFPHHLKRIAENRNILDILTEPTNTSSNIYNINKFPIISKGDSFGENNANQLSCFLENPQKFSPFFIPSFNAGPDLCFFIERCDGGGLIPVFIQLKLSHDVSRVAALSTTDPLKFYRDKNNKKIENYMEERKKCIDIINNQYNKTHIGILIAYPKSWLSSTYEKKDNDGWVRYEKVFDGTLENRIFDETHLIYLAGIGITP